MSPVDRIASRRRARAERCVKAIRAPATTGSIPTGTALAEVEKAVQRAPIRATETLLTAAFVAYASDVSTGRVRANRVDKDIDISQRKVERADLLKAAAEAARLRRLARRLPPKGDYPALQKALADLARQARARRPSRQLPDGDLR